MIFTITHVKLCCHFITDTHTHTQMKTHRLKHIGVITLVLPPQAELNRRVELQERLVATVAGLESEQLKRFEELMELKQRQEFQSMRDMLDKE